MLTLAFSVAKVQRYLMVKPDHLRAIGATINGRPGTEPAGAFPLGGLLPAIHLEYEGPGCGRSADDRAAVRGPYDPDWVCDSIRLDRLAPGPPLRLISVYGTHPEIYLFRRDLSATRSPGP